MSGITKRRTVMENSAKGAKTLVFTFSRLRALFGFELEVDSLNWSANRCSREFRRYGLA